MKSINSFGKVFFLTLFLNFFSAIGIFAQSTVFFFTPSTNSNECFLKMNGNLIGELRGPLKKTMENSMFQIPYKVYDAAYKKCVIKEEGKVLFAVDYKFTNCRTLAVSEVPSEIQINLSQGSVHYVKLAPKGFSNMEFKEISEKEATKLFKKSVALPEYIQE